MLPAHPRPFVLFSPPRHARLHGELDLMSRYPDLHVDTVEVGAAAVDRLGKSFRQAVLHDNPDRLLASELSVWGRLNSCG